MSEPRMMLDFHDRKLGPGFWYVATPFSKYPGGLHLAFVHACKATGGLLERGFKVFSPIAHSYPIAIQSMMDPLDHGIWLPADKPMMDAAHGLIVVMMPGWDTSYGIGEEIKVFEAAGKPIRYLPWFTDAAFSPAVAKALPEQMGTIVERLYEASNNHALSIGEAWNLIEESVALLEEAERVISACLENLKFQHNTFAPPEECGRCMTENRANALLGKLRAEVKP